MNRDTFQRQWGQLKGKLRQKWGRLTDDDIERVAGSYDELVGKLREKYGVTSDRARQMIDDWKP